MSFRLFSEFYFVYHGRLYYILCDDILFKLLIFKLAFEQAKRS